MDIGAMFKLGSLWKKFSGSHPKLPQFLSAVRQAGVGEGSVLGISVEALDGKRYETNLRLTAEDLQLLEELKILSKK